MSKSEIRAPPPAPGTRRFRTTSRMVAAAVPLGHEWCLVSTTPDDVVQLADFAVHTRRVWSGVLAGLSRAFETWVQPSENRGVGGSSPPLAIRLSCKYAVLPRSARRAKRQEKADGPSRDRRLRGKCPAGTGLHEPRSTRCVSCADAAALGGSQLRSDRSDEFVRALAGLVCLRWSDRRCPRGRRARCRQLLIARAARWNRASLVLDAVEVEAGRRPSRSSPPLRGGLQNCRPASCPVSSNSVAIGSPSKRPETAAFRQRGGSLDLRSRCSSPSGRKLRTGGDARICGEGAASRVRGPRVGRCSDSSKGAVSGGSSREPQTAGFVEEQRSLPALLLIVCMKVGAVSSVRWRRCRVVCGRSPSLRA
jgi:hypothetical protein